VRRVLVTGANGHLGRRLVEAIDGPVRAVVRSRRAADMLDDHGDVRVVDYTDADALADACTGCSAVVHLVGIIKEGAGSSYRTAHVDATRALLAAATPRGVERIVYLSILGADEHSPNPCLASKAQAETLLLASPVPSLVLRVPMVLGEGDIASRSLLASASRGFNLTFRAASREQPIYAGDVVDAILAGLAPDGPTGVVELAGPRSLSRGDLVKAASMVGTTTMSLPLWIGLCLAGIMEAVSRNPPVTRAMLGVLDHDDDIDPEPASAALGIQLTSFEETLARISNR